MNRLLGTLLLVLLVALSGPTSAQQLRRSPRQMVKGGRLERPDTARLTGADSLFTRRMIDSLRALATDSLMMVDSLKLDSLKQLAREKLLTTDRLDSLQRERADSLLDMVGDSLLLKRGLLDSLDRRDSLLSAKSDTTKRRKGWLMSDSMSLSRVCWTSAILPGYGQIYNKQYWKLPILYGTLAAGIGLYVHETNQYRPLKKLYDEVTSLDRTRSEALDNLQHDMIRHNTMRQIYLFASIASYLYFIGDAAINYSTNDVSNVKKATTLATICPGAGQIYNKSYWRVPFVVGGVAAMIYCVDWNNRGYQRFKKAYSLRADYDNAMNLHKQNPELYPEPSGSTDEFKGRYSASFLKNLRDNYRRNRDLCIIVTAGIYILQIVDAHVDAHLKEYDISDDLSMSIQPMLDYTYVPTLGDAKAVVGFNLNLNF
ncbi:MAG: hypothetical protein E7137_06875 [Rikenellaceae bacterium]|nr:hypothetical protein [Rikenellaceae bacterium]